MYCKWNVIGVNGIRANRKSGVPLILCSWLSCLDTNPTGWDCSGDCPVQLHSTWRYLTSWLSCSKTLCLQWNCLTASPHTSPLLFWVHCAPQTDFFTHAQSALLIINQRHSINAHSSQHTLKLCYNMPCFLPHLGQGWYFWLSSPAIVYIA